MNLLLVADLVVLAIALVITTCTRWGRARVADSWLGEILARLFPALRYLLTEWPLRAITGRWPADPQRIAELERSELGYPEPEPAPAVFADTDLHDMIAGRMNGECLACRRAAAYWSEEATAPATVALAAAGFDPAGVLRAFGIPPNDIGPSLEDA